MDRLIKLFREFRFSDSEIKPYVGGRIGVLSANLFLDFIERIVLILILLIGIYGTADAVFIFYNSRNDVSGVQHKPEAIEELKSIVGENYVGWVHMNDTNIDYPVMQGSDNTTYLSINAYGEYSLSGSIFLDAYNNRDFKDHYNLLYGHHMDKGFMFGALDAYSNEEYMLEHQYGWLETEGGEYYKLTAFTFINGDAADDEIFNTTLAKRDLIAYSQGRKVVWIPGIYDGSQKILALTTCKTPASTRRTIVLCVMEKTDKSIVDSDKTNRTESIIK